MNQNFGFVSFPDELTTCSSIMPHKKNPDVWELIRAKCNQLQSLPFQYAQILSNLPSGYHRDMQVIKESYIPSFQTVKDCLDMANVMLQHIHLKDNLMDDEKYLYLYSVEVVNQLVMQGIPFREAYIQVGKSIENGTFNKRDEVHHTHEGSIGNLCLKQIRQQRETVLSTFPFEKINQQLHSLLYK
jgi:argininosuccinate lyase